MHLDFIKTPFTNNPSMQKYSGDLINNSPRPKYIEEKTKQISLLEPELCGETELFQNLQLLDKVSDLLKMGKFKTIKDLSIQVEEDIAIMHKGKLEAISFCFPSGWIPTKALGQDFAFLHEPVADNDLLIKSSQKLSKYMCSHSIQRWVWNVTTIKNLSNHPTIKRPKLTSFDELYFRLETQISTPVDEETSLFLVLVEVVPLSKVWNSRILESINSMSDNVLNYKNLIEIKKYLNGLKF